MAPLTSQEQTFLTAQLLKLAKGGYFERGPFFAAEKSAERVSRTRCLYELAPREWRGSDYGRTHQIVRTYTDMYLRVYEVDCEDLHDLGTAQFLYELAPLLFDLEPSVRMHEIREDMFAKKLNINGVEYDFAAPLPTRFCGSEQCEFAAHSFRALADLLRKSGSNINAYVDLFGGNDTLVLFATTEQMEIIKTIQHLLLERIPMEEVDW